MKIRLLTAVIVVALWGCEAEKPNGGGSSASGSVALSRDDSVVYAVDPDLDALFVVQANEPTQSRMVKVGKTPEKVLVAPDDTVYVANKFGRSVSVVRKGETTVSATIPAGIEPVGLAVSTDGRTLYVVNASSRQNLDVGSVMAFDTLTFERLWETLVGAEPRGITLLGNGKALVSLFKEGDVVTIDARTGSIEKASIDAFAQLNRTSTAIQGSVSEQSARTRRPRALAALTTNPEGTQVYVAGLLSSDATLNTRPTDGTKPVEPNFRGESSSSGYGASSGCGGQTLPVSTPALLTLDGDGNAQVDDLEAGGCGSFLSSQPVTSRPPTLLPSNVAGVPLQGPSAIALDPSGSFLFIAHRESNNVAVVPTQQRTSSNFSVDPFKAQVQVINVGAGPSGVAVTHDGKSAWVYSAFDHSLARLSATDGVVRQTGSVTLSADVLPPDVVAGRKLFFSALDTRMNNPQLGISCSTCHVEAREDGHKWNTTEGPRNTPSLIGKRLAETAPFHWNGEFETVSQFMLHTTRDRMGGKGPSVEMERQLMAFIASVPAADNPFTTETPAETLTRGRAAFEKAECNSCHAGELFTDNKFYDVGTYVTTGTVTDRREFLFHDGLNTPSLLGIARTGPFLHDGSAPTLKARILIKKDANLHGKTSRLAGQEVDDLVAYLQSL